MADSFKDQEKKLNDSETAFSIPMDTSKVLTDSIITLGVVNYVLRPDAWLILRNVDWFQNLINVFLGAWIIGFINVIIKLLMEHNSVAKIQKLEMSELYAFLASFVLWGIGLFIYIGRFNQRFKFTYIERQSLVDEIDSKLRLKYKKNVN